jgi:hypothetical protein
MRAVVTANLDLQFTKGRGRLQIKEVNKNAESLGFSRFPGV